MAVAGPASSSSVRTSAREAVPHTLIVPSAPAETIHLPSPAKAIPVIGPAMPFELDHGRRLCRLAQHRAAAAPLLGRKFVLHCYRCRRYAEADQELDGQRAP